MQLHSTENEPFKLIQLGIYGKIWPGSGHILTFIPPLVSSSYGFEILKNYQKGLLLIRVAVVRAARQLSLLGAGAGMWARPDSQTGWQNTYNLVEIWAPKHSHPI